MITGIFFHFVHDVELSLPAVCSGDPSTGPVARESTDNVIYNFGACFHPPIYARDAL